MSFVNHFTIYSNIVNHRIHWVIALIDSNQNLIETKLFCSFIEFYDYINYLKDLKIRCSNEYQILDYDLRKDSCIIHVKEDKKIEEV